MRKWPRVGAFVGWPSPWNLPGEVNGLCHQIVRQELPLDLPPQCPGCCPLPHCRWPSRSVSLVSWLSLGFLKGEHLRIYCNPLSATKAHLIVAKTISSKCTVKYLPQRQLESPQIWLLCPETHPLLRLWHACKFRCPVVLRFGKAQPVPRSLDLNLVLDSKWQ